MHAFDDATAALLSGEYQAAIDMYQRIITDDTLKPWWLWEEEILYAAPYARYRLILTYTLAGDYDSAQAEYEQLVVDYFSEDSEPQLGADYAEIAVVFWEAYGETANVTDACMAVIEYARVNPSPVEFLRTNRIDTTIATPRDLCPFVE